MAGAYVVGACVAGSVYLRGVVCMVGEVHGRGWVCMVEGHAWWGGGMHGGGYAW